MSTACGKRSVHKISVYVAPLAILGLVVAGAICMRARGSASVPSPRVTTITQITHDGFRKTNLLADDNQLYVTELPASQRVIAKVSLTHSDRSLVPSPFSNLQALDLSPDRTKLLVAPIQAGSSEDEFWTLPVAAGSAQRIGNLAGRDAAWSADGQHLVFSKGSVLYLASASGTEVRELYTASGSVFGPHFSPDGKRIRFTVGDTAQNTTALWEVAQDGSTSAWFAGEVAIRVQRLLRQLDRRRALLYFSGSPKSAEHEHDFYCSMGFTRICTRGGCLPTRATHQRAHVIRECLAGARQHEDVGHWSRACG